MRFILQLPKVVALFLIRLYQLCLSPYLGRSCRFYPSCSQYSLQCFQRFSFLVAMWYSTKRLLRCQPFSKGGPDLAPAAKKLKELC